MEWVKTINNAIEYMENHLTDDITLSDIAESVYISAFHFQRAFSMMAGISPAFSSGCRTGKWKRTCH